MKHILIALIVLFHLPSLSGQELRLSSVLEAVAKTHPKLEETRANIQVEEGRRVSSGKAFEPKVKGESLGLPLGFYQYHRMAVRVEQALPVGGVSVSGGYRRSDGTLPPYYQEYLTRSGGEVFAKIDVPILGGSRIDKERADLCKAMLAVESREQDLNLKYLELARDSTLAYWKWVAAGQRLHLLRNLLFIAEERADQLRLRVENGASAEITLVENAEQLLSRRASVLKAEDSFASAQNELSLFYRDLENVPILAGSDLVPKKIAPVPIDEAEIDAWACTTIEERPDWVLLELEERQARLDLQLAHNAGLPKLDLCGYVARDIGVGKASLGQTDVGVGVSCSLALYQREARGGKRTAQAKLAAIEAKRRGLCDKLQADFAKLLVNLQLAQERLGLASERIAAAEKLVNAEQQRFEEGASDLLSVNLRELALASAVEDAIGASLHAQTGLAKLMFIRGTAVGSLD